MKSRSDAFARRDGALFVEDLPLAELAAAREGHPAWVLSHAAIGAALADAAGPRLLPVAAVGPIEVLAMAASAGWWAAAWSSHELRLALEAGFAPGRVVASGGVRDDGFLKDALVAGVAVVPVVDETDAGNVARIAGWLGVEPPPREGAPDPAPADLLAAVGGLLAPALSHAPALSLDAPLPSPADDGLVRLDVWSLRDGEDQAGQIAGLSRWEADDLPRDALVHGPVARGEWVFVPHPAAAALRRHDPTHAEPAWVMVNGSAWREFPPRAYPAPATPG